MKGYLWAAMFGVVEFLAGAWLIGAPWFTGIQSGNSWPDTTTTMVWTGIGLAVLGLISAIAFVAAAFREQGRRVALAAPHGSHAADRQGMEENLAARAARSVEELEQSSVATTVSQVDLVSLAHQLLDDLKSSEGRSTER